MIKLVVFDWNGTLLADTNLVLDAFNREIHVFNHEPISLQEYRLKRDVPLWKFFENIGIDRKLYDERVIEATKAFHANYEPRASRARTRRGAKKLLQALKERGIDCIILSNHTVEGIYLQLERLHLTQYFDDVLANDNIHKVHHSGKHDYLVEYIKQGRVDPAQIAIVGDTVEEIEIGKNLGLKTVAISGGYNATSRLVALKPDVLIHNLADLIPVINQL